MARKKHAAAQPDARLLLISRCDSHHTRSGTVARGERTATTGFVRELPSLPGRLPDASFRRTLRDGCQKVHFLPDRRAARFHPGRVSRADGESRFRLRHLSGRLSLEPARAAYDDPAGPAKSFSCPRRKSQRELFPAARRITLPSKTRVAPSTKRNSISRTLSRKPRQAHTMARSV